MRKNVKLKTIIYVCILMMFATLSGCSDKKSNDGIVTFTKSWNDTENAGQSETNDSENGSYMGQYMIININTADEILRVYRYSNGLEYQYYYENSTEFSNKYGDHTTVADFSAGDVVSLSGTDSNGKLKGVKKSDAVWVYDDITRFSFGKDSKVLTIADSDYEINNQTFIFSGNTIITADEISQDDEISVVGVDKKILSIVVTTGHGILKLTNTDLFEGSMLQLGDDIFTEIIKNMELEVPEGKYKLVVANNGWGGTTEIEIKRNGTTTVNLDKLKGKGPKKGKISFEVDVANARIFVDNQKINISKPVELTYGAHSLVVMADGYTTWSKTLYVNSKKATVIVTLTDSDDSQESSSQSSTKATQSSTKETQSSDKETQSSQADENSHRDPSSEHTQPEEPTAPHDRNTQTGNTQTSE